MPRPASRTRGAGTSSSGAREPAPGLVERLAQDGDLHAPHLIDTEVLHALRRLLRRRQISAERAYDATFVALAEALDVPLVTCDARLAAAPGHHARIELYDNRRRS